MDRFLETLNKYIQLLNVLTECIVALLGHDKAFDKFSKISNRGITTKDHYREILCFSMI